MPIIRHFERYFKNIFDHFDIHVDSDINKITAALISPSGQNVN